MRSAGLCSLCVLAATLVSASCGAGEPEARAPVDDMESGSAQVMPVNDLPNPYDRIEPWATLPDGVESWPAVTGAEPGPDGNLYVFYRCFENSCLGRPEDPIVKFDMSGQPIDSWGAGMFMASAISLGYAVSWAMRGYLPR